MSLNKNQNNVSYSKIIRLSTERHGYFCAISAQNGAAWTGRGQPKLGQTWRRYTKELTNKRMIKIGRGTAPIYKNLNSRHAHTARNRDLHVLTNVTFPIILSPILRNQLEYADTVYRETNLRPSTVFQMHSETILELKCISLPNFFQIRP